MFTINAMMNLFGDMHERINGGKAAKDVNCERFHLWSNLQSRSMVFDFLSAFYDL